MTGLYFYPGDVSSRASEVVPSDRGELEITSLNEMYLNDGLLDVQLLSRGFAWLDTGTIDSLSDASDFVRVVQKRQGVQIAAPEEIAFKYDWISEEKLLEAAEKYKKTAYGQHLAKVAERKMYD